MIEIDPSALTKAEAMLKDIPGAIHKAMGSAVKKSLAGARSDAAKEVSRRYRITQKEVRKTFDIKVGNGTAQLISKGRVTGLVKFKTQPKNPEGQLSYTKRKKYIYASVVNGQGGTIAHAFIARMKNGHIGVFQRNEHGNSNESSPLHELHGPSIPQTLAYKDVAEMVEKGIGMRLEKNIDHEINAFLMGYRR